MTDAELLYVLGEEEPIFRDRSMTKFQELDGVRAALDLLFEKRTELLNEDRANWAQQSCDAFHLICRVANYLVETYITPHVESEAA